MRYLAWQFRHLHTLHFDLTPDREVYCPRCGDIYQNRKTMSTNSTKVRPSTQTPAPKKSVLVLIALLFLLASFVVLGVAALVGSAYLAVFAIVDALASITFAILSLRETN